MATPTSSSNRSKRKTNKPVTTDKGRTNRAKVSTAKTTSSDTRSSNSGTRVTNASQRTSTGSARVTGTSRQALPAKSSASDLQRLKTASKTKPSSPAPTQVIKKPVTRTGPVKGPVPPKGSSPVTMPNSRRAGVNLPQAGARAERTAQRVTDLKKASAEKASTPKPAPSAAKPTVASRLGNAARKATDWVSGNTPKQQAKPASRLAEVLGGDRPAASRIGRGLVGKGGIAAMALGAANAADDARLTPAQLKKKYETVNPDRGQNLLTKLQNGTLGQRDATVKRDPNGRSSRGVNTPKGRTVATGSQQYNDYRNKQIADNRERLKGVGNPPKPNPPAPPRRNPPAPAADQRRSGGGGNNNAPRSQTPPAPRFTGTVDEGRKMWAEKYSSSKYDGQAIQKEAKKLLDEMKKRREDKSNATKAGWDGNKNY